MNYKTKIHLFHSLYVLPFLVLKRKLFNEIENLNIQTKPKTHQNQNQTSQPNKKTPTKSRRDPVDYKTYFAEYFFSQDNNSARLTLRRLRQQ